MAPRSGLAGEGSLWQGQLTTLLLSLARISETFRVTSKALASASARYLTGCLKGRRKLHTTSKFEYHRAKHGQHIVRQKESIGLVE